MIVRLLAILILPILAAISLPSGTAQAATFDPGRIIDDVIFTNASSMSVAQIQSFLNSKVPTCDTNGAQQSEMNNAGVPDYNSNGSIQRWEWGKYHYNQTTFPCLRDYSQDGVSSAQLIYNASQTYAINPQVLIVLLQKEQGLVTDTWPLDIQYRSATGYGCPDTAACDSQYYGLINQLNWASTMFRSILNNSPTWYTPYILGNNYIRYNPVVACGGTIVNIQNRSTQALYNYTPYQPNASALNAGYGMGDACGAYGNRNFWLYFNDWFGSTQAASYSWQLTGQYAYTDETKATIANLSTLMPGQRAYIGFTAKNTGNRTWSNTGANPVRVGSLRPTDHPSSFYESSWLGYSRPTALKEASVAPGEIGTFEFWIQAPSVTSATNYSAYFGILAEGAAWMPDVGLYYGMRVSPPTYTWGLVGQAAYTDDTKTTATGLDRMNAGERKFISLVIKNTGNTTWSNTGPNPINLGSTRPTDRASAFYDPSWLAASRPARMKEASVAPGQNATFEFWVKAPTSTSGGSFREHFTPLAEGYTWMPDIGLNYAINVQAAAYTWSLVGQAAYTDDTKTTVTGLDRMESSQRKFISLVIKNTGNMTWSNTGPNPIDLGSTRPTDRLSPFFDDSWLGQSRPARMQEASVAPGQNATFEFWMKAPHLWKDGDFLEYFTPVAEGIAWMPDIGLNYRTHVVGATYSWSLQSQYAYSDDTKTTAIGLANLTPGQLVYLGFTAKNTGTITWTNSGVYPVRVGTSSPNDHIGILCEGRWISCSRPALMQEASVAPGQTGTFEFWAKAPQTTGIHREYYNLLSEKQAWMTNINFNYTLSVR